MFCIGFPSAFELSAKMLLELLAPLTPSTFYDFTISPGKVGVGIVLNFDV